MWATWLALKAENAAWLGLFAFGGPLLLHCPDHLRAFRHGVMGLGSGSAPRAWLRCFCV